jgi:nucleotidyltransferase substrate binding protein (TIGR01987 family)
MATEDIRWIQRFNNYRKALLRLNKAIELSEERELTDLEQQGLIQGFEFTFEMAWKTLRDYIVDKGYEGEREKPIRVIVDAAERGLIDEKNWRKMYEGRNKTSHSYDEKIADDIAENIIGTYHHLFIQLETRLQLERLNQERNLFNQD